MPIYEFYCDACNTLFNFFSKSVNTDTVPKCPRCGAQDLARRMSAFAVTGRAREDAEMRDPPFDEGKMEKAMEMMAREAEKIQEDDPRQAANLMRRMTDMTGIELGAGMQDALSRMEAGEDPDAIEAQMGDIMENEEPFVLPGKKGGAGGVRRNRPSRDETLYDL